MLLYLGYFTFTEERSRNNKNRNFVFAKTRLINFGFMKYWLLSKICIIFILNVMETFWNFNFNDKYELLCQSKINPLKLNANQFLRVLNLFLFEVQINFSQVRHRVGNYSSFCEIIGHQVSDSR